MGILTCKKSHKSRRLYVALEMIPVENKRDYVEALRLAPLLVQTESNPVKFLRVEDFNPWKGARRLVLYWEYRRKYFKKSRWLLSLNDDSGAGALDGEDVRLLRSGWLAFVAPRDPRKGRFILINHGRYPKQPIDSRIRVLMYLFSTASDIHGQTEPGVRGIRLVPTAEPGGREPEFSNPRFAQGKAIFTEAMPIRFRGILLLSLEEDTMAKIMNWEFNRISSLLAAMLNTQRPFLVSISKISKAVDALSPFGVPPEVLPVSHGGSFTYAKMFEWKTIIVNQQDNAANCVKIPWITDTDPSGDKTKEVNALYARRAYHKRKLRVSTHKDEAKRLKVVNERLKEENAFLESSMQRARDILALVGDAEPELPEFDVGVESFDDPIPPSGSVFNDDFASTL